MKIIEKISKSEAALILFSILNRIPVIVFGDNSDEVNDILIEFSEMVNFRKEFVFYTDFISNEEYEYLIQNENIDFNSQRFLVRCPCSVSIKALNQFNEFKSWLIGFEIPLHRKDFLHLQDLILVKIKKYLSIYLIQNKVSLKFHGINKKGLDLSLEYKILQDIFENTEKAIIKMKRVLQEKMNSEILNDDLTNTLLDFTNEKQILIKNILQKEVQDFYYGAKRAFFILTKLNLLKTFDIDAKIGTKTLFETISYYDASIERLLNFIFNEWGENFLDLVDDGKKTNVLDSIQSLWG